MSWSKRLLVLPVGQAKGALRKQLLTLLCLVCGKKLANAGTANECMPSGGVAFLAAGNYGSRHFDSPLFPEHAEGDRNDLEINVCDDCVVKGINRGAVQLREVHEHVTIKLRQISPKWIP